MKVLSGEEVKELSQSFINIINILTPSVDTKEYQESIDEGLSNFGHTLELAAATVNAIYNPE